MINLDGKTQKVILLEKPFIEKYLSKREINEKFYKKSLIVTLVKNQAGPLRQKISKINTDVKSSPVKESERILEKLNIDYDVMSNFESFGVESRENQQLNEDVDHNTEIKKIEKIKKRNRVSNDSAFDCITPKKMKSNNSSDYEDYGDETDSDDFLLAKSNNENKKEDEKLQIENKEAPLSPEKTFMSSNETIPKVIPLNKSSESLKISSEISEKHKTETATTDDTKEKLSLFDLISKLQDKLVEKPLKNNQPPAASHQDQKEGQFPIENANEYNYLDNIHGNLNYSLWNLDSLKILIRSSTVGYINTEQSSMNPVVIYPKIEYQPQFGCERLSIKDYCKMWSKSLLRNYCDIYLCRINIFTNKLISVTDIKFDQLIPDDLQFNSNQTLYHLKKLINKIQVLENGSYILRKETLEKNFELLKSVGEKTW